MTKRNKKCPFFLMLIVGVLLCIQIQAEETAVETYKYQDETYQKKGFFSAERQDQDQDGVMDIDDNCPNTPKGHPVDSCGCPLGPCQIDSDEDGISDCYDQCANTALKTRVNLDGCPLNDPCRIDTDKDGIADCNDKCPNTPPDVLVDALGCPFDACRIDSDKDGVPDCRDKCPDTIVGTLIDENGCPLPPKVVAPPPVDPCSFDADGDGINDCEDKCPNTPKGVVVTADGCPDVCPDKGDDDNDGVLNCRDQCPNSLPEFAVDAVGCHLLALLPCAVDLDVKFDYDKWDIKGQYVPDLDKLRDFLIRYPDTTVVLEGHTDSRGKDEYNKQLGYWRGQAARRYVLQTNEIAPSRVKVLSFGESAPLADNRNDAGRAINRRVTAYLEREETGEGLVRKDGQRDVRAYPRCAPPQRNRVFPTSP